MEHEAQACLTLLHNADFKRLYHRTNEELLSWVQFRRLPMPDGFTAEEIWQVLSALRRLEAHVFPYRPYTHEQQPEETWCSLDNHIGVMLKELVSLSAEDSSAALAQHRYQFLTVLSDDIAAAAGRDGVALEKETVLRVIGQQVTAQTNEERLAKNAAEIILSIEKYAKYPLTPWMIDDFIAHLDAGSALEAQADEVRRRLYDFSSQTDDQILDALFASTNTVGDDRGVYLLDLTSTSTALWDLSPFPRWNGLIEVFLRHWALERHGFSLLRLVPFSRLGLLWDPRSATDANSADPRFEVNPDIGEAHDATSFFGNVIHVFLEELHRQLDLLNAETEEGESIPADVDASLNARQRDTLRNLLADPTRQTTIQVHMNLYGVSYGTARTDLLALADAGLLRQSYTGRAMVFAANPDRAKR